MYLFVLNDNTFFHLDVYYYQNYISLPLLLLYNNIIFLFYVVLFDLKKKIL